MEKGRTNEREKKKNGRERKTDGRTDTNERTKECFYNRQTRRSSGVTEDEDNAELDPEVSGLDYCTSIRFLHWGGNTRQTNLWVFVRGSRELSDFCVAVEHQASSIKHRLSLENASGRTRGFWEKDSEVVRFPRIDCRR